MTEHYHISPERREHAFTRLFPHSKYSEVLVNSGVLSQVLFWTDVVWSRWGAGMIKEKAQQGELYIHRISFSHLDHLHIDFYIDIVTPISKSVHLHFSSILYELREKLDPDEAFGGFGRVVLEDHLEMYVIGIEKDRKPSGVLWVTKGVETYHQRPLIPGHTARA